MSNQSNVLTTIFSGGPEYANLLINTYGASEVWALTDIGSGTTITASVDSARNGTLTGWALQNAASPVPGKLAPLSASGDFGNITTDSLISAFDPVAGSVFGWSKLTAGGGWESGDRDAMFRLSQDSNNLVYVNTNLTENELEMRFAGAGGGTGRTVTTTSLAGSLNWFSWGISWDSGAADELKFFLNGAQFDSTHSDVPTWSGAATLVLGVIGAASTGPIQELAGHVAYFATKHGAIFSPTDFLAMHNAAATSS